jgi:hypothetical protein
MRFRSGAPPALRGPGAGTSTDVAASAQRWARKAPRLGALLAYSNIGCAFWPVPPGRQPGPVSAPSAPPIVLIGSTADPATPYAWAATIAFLATPRGRPILP